MSSLVMPSVGLKDHVSLPVYLQGEEQEKEGKEVEVVRKRNGFYLGSREEVEESSESSSIGPASSSSPSEKEEEEASGQGEEEVESKRKDGALGCLDSLEESLPIKRGLSNFFSGKSKSFASLSDVANASAKDIVKAENPFNKRRRLLMMSKMRRASCSSLICPPLMTPLLSPAHTVEEADEEEEEKEEEKKHDGRSSPPPLAPFPHRGSHNIIKKKPFRSPRSFSLSDLQHV